MVERVRLVRAEGRVATGGNYFGEPKSETQFIKSGCKPFDLALGGGWARRRIANIVGDRSSGKTLLCIEASANFVVGMPKAKIRYRECESAFDDSYAKALGFPLAQVERDTQLETIEDMFEDMSKVIEGARGPELYIIDSLDALSDRAEMDRDIDEGSFGASKAKQLSQLFRRLVQQLAKKDVTVIIVSQVRDNIGVTYGRKTKRSGGRAMDFYASQVVFLSQLGVISKTKNKISRPVALRVRAKCDKNKVSLPFREAEFEIQFGFGIDDVKACCEWLQGHNFLADVNLTNEGLKKYYPRLASMSQADYQRELKELQNAVERRWWDVENQFLPSRKKYL